MKRTYHKNNCYVSVTTRKANFADVYFGKFTFWLSQRHYKNGDCEKAITYTSIPLGNENGMLDIEATSFINKVISQTD